MISVLISTKNRSKNIIQCLRSLLKNSHTNFEILVIDQSVGNETQHALVDKNSSRIIYVRHPFGGKTGALNKGLQQARGDIIVFTDDDCIARADWLTTIQSSFKQYPQISSVFGRTLPYHPSQHGGQTCPCTFTHATPAMAVRPCVHYQHIGFGNNMAIRTSSLKAVGGFKKWLGPGSIGSNAEDAEIALRLLIKGHKILYNPKAIVYHNKWLKHKQMKKQTLSYICGEMACYGYFCFQGHEFARTVVLNNLRDSLCKTKRLAKNILLLRWDFKLTGELYDTVSEMIWRGRGLLISLVYALVDPIR